MAFRWVRSQRGAGLWSTTQQNVLLASLVAGETLIRSRIFWGVSGMTTTTVDASQMMVNWLASGIVTTVGNGTEAVPDVVLHPGNAAPPTQRWLYVESRHVRPTVFDATNDIAVWADTGPQEPPDSKGEVLATGLPAGDTLNVWWVTKAEFDWDSVGFAWVFASIVLAIKEV